MHYVFRFVDLCFEGVVLKEGRVFEAIKMAKNIL